MFKQKKGLIILILMLSVGFAAVATNLIINGSATVGVNPADFDIYFSFAKAEQGGTATISEDKHSITYSTKTLTTVGEKARLDYTVTNNSSNYDADVTVIWNAVDTISGKDYSEYYTVTRTGFESGVETTVEAKTSVDGAIEITLIKPILEEVEIESSMTYDAIPQERTLKRLGSPLKRRTLPEMILRDNVLREDTPDLHEIAPQEVKVAKFDSDPFTVDKSDSAEQDRYITYSDSYEFDSGSSYSILLTNPKTCKWSECYNDLIGKYVLNPYGSDSSEPEEPTSWPSKVFKITSDTTLNTLSAIVSDYELQYDYSTSGFYSMNVTNGFGGQSEGISYYFRGKVENNYVQFGTWETGVYIGRFNDYPDYVVFRYSTLEECMAGGAYGRQVDYCDVEQEPGRPMIWRVVRINEDGTVRLMLDGRISEYTTSDENRFSDDYQDPMSVYYSNSNVKNTIENWYDQTITERCAERVATGNYFCESFKATSNGSADGDASAPMYNEYTPNLSCITDGNGKGLVNGYVALPNYDEVVLAGGYNQRFNERFYMYKYGYEWWTMSPAGYSLVWRVKSSNGHMTHNGVLNYHDLRPVINIKADTYATGTGTKDDPYVIELNN